MNDPYMKSANSAKVPNFAQKLHKYKISYFIHGTFIIPEPIWDNWTFIILEHISVVSHTHKFYKCVKKKKDKTCSQPSPQQHGPRCRTQLEEPAQLLLQAHSLCPSLEKAPVWRRIHVI